MKPAVLKDILDRLPGSLLITDTESKVLYASSALERRTGFSVAEIVGKKPGQLWGGKMSRSFYQALWQTIGTEGESFVGRVKNSKKNGAQNNEHIFIVPITDDSGATVYFVEVHPELSGREDEEEFGREFLKRTDAKLLGRDFFSWLFQQLRKKQDGTVVEMDRSLWYGGVRDAAHFLRDTFVAPMEKVLSRRREDALLIASAQANPELFSELYKKYASLMKEYFLRRLQGDVSLAEDLTQEVFVRAFRYLPSFRMANASYYTYLLHVAHSILVNFYRKRQYGTISYGGGNEIGVASIADEEAIHETIESLLKTLSEVERTIMLFKYRDGLKVKEIAQAVGKTENAVKLVLSRSRKKLKKELK